MIALWIFLLPLIGACLAPFARRAARPLAIVVLAADAMALIRLWRQAAPADTTWLAAWTTEWVPQLGINFAFGIDGFALSLSLMACLVALAALAGTPGRGEEDGAFCGWFLLGVAAVLGVFLATDLFLFFVCFELMLLPTVVLIVRWGSGEARAAALRFFVYTQTGGLLMLVSIVGLHVVHHTATGVRTFDTATLAAMPLPGMLGHVFLIGFLAAFAVKLPMVPFHTWQARAYACAPTEGAILLAALMAKTAGYGLLRFVLPLFPAAAMDLAPWIVAIGILTVLYAAWLAYGQQDIVRVIAYSSASHLGYVVVGALAFNDLGRTGAVVQMVCHGLSVTGLLLVFAHMSRTTGARDLRELGGVWRVSPSLGAFVLVFVLATLGLPGFGNFMGEFMALAGLFQRFPLAGSLGAIGAVLSAAYALRLLQRTCFGAPTPPGGRAIGLPATSVLVSAALIVGLIWMGVRPQPLVDLVSVPTLTGAEQLAQGRLE